jgi:hypothetical protein
MLSARSNSKVAVTPAQAVVTVHGTSAVLHWQLAVVTSSICCKHLHAGDGPYDFMLDSGLTAELITPELRQHLGISGSKGKVAGLAAGGASAAGDLVRPKHLCLCCLATATQPFLEVFLRSR